MDQAEFTAFYHETAAVLRGYIRRVSGDGQAADDLLQETYLRFLRATPAGDRAAMKAYLYKTATAAIYDRWRKGKRERLWWLTFRFREEAPAVAGTGDVTRCFEKLKPRERALLWLAYVEGYDHGEIAGTLDLNEKSIKVLLFRARRNLERILRQNGVSEVNCERA
jgi:RNA polymerase sigma-70 factor (ECF subfamily)